LALLALVLGMMLMLAAGQAALAGNGPSGFPLPKDATGGAAAPGGGGKIVVYDVPRGRDAVAAEVKQLLAKDGWKLDSEQTSPRGSVRLVASKAGTVVKASLAGDAQRAALILTLP
jgi:hypothetical protein